MHRLARPLLYAGVVVVVFGLSVAHGRYVADPPYDFTGSFRFSWAIAYALLLALAAYGVGLPDLPRTARGALGSALVAAGGAAVGISLLQLVVGDALLPRLVVFGSALLLVPWYLLCTAISRGGAIRAGDRDQVLAVAGDAELAALVDELAHHPERPAQIVAKLRPSEAAEPGRRSGRLAEEARATGATLVVLDREAQLDEAVIAQVARLHEQGVRVRSLTSFYDEWLGKFPLSELERVSLLFDIGEVHRARYGRIKRLIDTALAVVGLVPLVLLLPVVLVANLFGNRGPLFYRQNRVGKQGEVFSIVKLRTMRPASDEAPKAWTAEHDPRITPFGRFLRTTHLDELPQVLNILRGELAVVGPRPEQPHYVAELEAKLPFYELRHLVRPGLTGWAQVKYGYAGDERDAMEKLQYEFYYLRHQSLLLDLRIVGRTVRSVLGREGR